MNFKTGVWILGMAAMAISQITEGNGANQSVTQTTAQTGLSKTDIGISKVKADLISASTISKTGAVLYCVGAAVEVTGFIVGVGGVSSGDVGTGAGGVGMIIAGELVNFTGNIVACAGGSRAKRILRNSGNIAPPYHGWALFWGSMGLSLVSGFVHTTSAAYYPLQVGSLAMSIGSVVSAVRYTKNANSTQISSDNFSIYPVVSMSKDNKTYGMVLNAGF